MIVLVMGCGNAPDPIECNADRHCHLNNGAATCDDGYVWRNAQDSADYECIPVQTQRPVQPQDCEEITTCSGHGLCVTIAGQVGCVCDEGYVSELRSCVTRTADPCSGWPTVQVAAPNCGPRPLAVQFDGSSAVDGLDWYSPRWEFGDGDTAFALATSHTYNETGDYETLLRFEVDSEGTHVTINISDIPVRVLDTAFVEIEHACDAVDCGASKCVLLSSGPVCL
ncbi:MAG: hypothetical protein A2289_03560 [Deltaproteobacteria bacterium RIFOXYA12_FULL_58_15]|nr:MAG: hypothetical protein A2289_03560 [Deltaproteobacteria bacterium RIFOXYA12_FULL_58_15]OGR13319.1 MAG: hypothetical protein A2341_02335 [Deltaproteobacteria bacterium RIFOXYB12_FULL_58_9]